MTVSAVFTPSAQWSEAVSSSGAATATSELAKAIGDTSQYLRLEGQFFQAVSSSSHDLAYGQDRMKHDKRNHDQGEHGKRQNNNTSKGKPTACSDDTRQKPTGNARLQPDSCAAHAVFNTVSPKNTLIHA